MRTFRQVRWSGGSSYQQKVRRPPLFLLCQRSGRGGGEDVILVGDLVCGGNGAEAFYIFEGALLEGGEGVGKAGDVFFGKVAVIAVYHVAHVADIYEEGFSGLLFAAGDEPEGCRNCYAVEKLGWHGDNSFY